MTIGSKFLDRVLFEGKDKPKGSKFDAATETLKKALRQIGGEKDFADKIVEVANLSGVPGRFMNTPEAKESIVNAATALRGRAAAVAAFLALHSALVGTVTEAAAAPAADEKDLEGVGFQQLVEEVLVALGIPVALVGKDASGQVKSKVRSAAREMMANAAVKEAYKFFAKKLGIKINDGTVGVKKPGAKVVKEEEDVAVDNVKDLNAAAMTIAGAMGINFQDEAVIRVINANTLARQIRTTARDAKVKRAMSAFLRIMNGA